MIGDLPRSLNVNGTEYDINTDFRCILDILEAFDDPNLENEDKVFVCLSLLYCDLESIPREDMIEAYNQAVRFIDYGNGDKRKPSPKVMDWEQDESILFPAINRIAGYETRSSEYIHWWTFLGYYMEISDGIFAKVLSIRYKKAKGKKLEKWEKEFADSNSSLIKLKRKRSDKELANIERIKKMNGG